MMRQYKKLLCKKIDKIIQKLNTNLISEQQQQQQQQQIII